MRATVCVLVLVLAGSVRGQPWTMYAVDGERDTLVRIDLHNGLATDIGPIGFDGAYWGLAFSPRPLPAAGGLTWPAETLFGIEVTTQSLYAFDLKSGRADRIGITYLLGFWESLTFDRYGTLWTTDVYDRYTLDTVSGLVSHVPGGFNVPVGVSWALDVLPVDVPYIYGTLVAGTIVGCRAGLFFALDGDTWDLLFTAQIPAADEAIAVTPDGTVYGIGGSPSDHQLWRIDLMTLSSTLIGSTGRNAIWGAAIIPAPPVGAPIGAWVLLAMGRRRRPQRRDAGG